MKKIYKIFEIAGINGPVYLTLLNRIIQGSAGLINLLLITKTLDKIEQGYYYTFSSILAVQIFFELGLSGILIQFFAHESTGLDFNVGINTSENNILKSRLSSLLRFSIKWYFYISSIFIFVIIFFGFKFFTKFSANNEYITWKTPWVLICISTVASLIISPLLAFFEGIGNIKEVAKIKFIQTVVQIVSLIIFFLSGLKLYSSPLSSIISFLVILIWILIPKNFSIFKTTWNYRGEYEINYWEEIFPLQWKIALSWISGYFIFQLFNPVLFATEGPVVAGQMGMSLGILNTILVFSLTWITTKVSTFSSLIAQNRIKELDNLFTQSFVQSTVANIFLLICFNFFVFFLQHYNITIFDKKISDRFLPIGALIMMSISIFLNHIIASLATYLRCHKKEPLLIQSIVMGILCTISLFVFSKTSGLFGVTFGYLIITILATFWTFYTFKTSKIKWHIN